MNSRLIPVNGSGKGFRRIGAIFLGLGVLMALPHMAASQGSCLNADDPTPGTPATLTLSGTFGVSEHVSCGGLTAGLKLTLDSPGFGTDQGPTTEKALDVDALGNANDAGQNVIEAAGSVTIYSERAGLRMLRQGTGSLKLDLAQGSSINTGWKGGTANANGIHLVHKGQAGEDTSGIELISRADIDVSKSKFKFKTGISVNTFESAANTKIPIVIRLAGGTVLAADTDPSNNAVTSQAGRGVAVEQHAKGGIEIKVEPGVKIGEKDEVVGAYGILSRIWPTSDGSIEITYEGEHIYAGTGIFADIRTARNAPASGSTGDITVKTKAGSKIVARENKDVNSVYELGISVTILPTASDGVITVAHDGSIDADGEGIRAEHMGTGGVTVKAGKGSTIVSKKIGIEVIGRKGITIALDGSIDAQRGIKVDQPSGKGDVMTVTTGKDSKVTAGGDGIVANGASTDVEIIHKGAIDAGRMGIFIPNSGTGDVTVTTEAGSRISARGDADFSSGINASVRGSVAAGDVTVTHGGEITAKDEGIYASNRNASSSGTGTLSVTTSEGSKVTAEKQGILVRHEGTGVFDVAVRGMVTGDSAHTGGSDTGYAGVHVQVKEDDITVGGGGTIVVGSRAHVHALSGDAVRADGHAGPVKIILELDEDGFAGHLEGRILNLEEKRTKEEETTTAQAELTFHTRAGTDGDAPLTGLTADDPVNGAIYRRKVSDGIYDEVIKGQLLTLFAENGKRTGYKFDYNPAVPRLYQDRARLYEALPSVLLDLNARPGVGAGMCEGGARAEVFMSEGERMAESSTTSAGWRKQALGWDVKRRVVEAGYDFPADGSLCVGISAGRRTVEADVMRGGGVKAEATGGAVTLGWRPDSGVDVSWRLSYSRLHDIELSPAGGGAVIAAPGGGGVSVSVAAGKRMEFQGMQVTPRAGFEFSSVETGGFTEPAVLEGAGEVSDVRAGSVKGTLGARIDMAAGEAGTLWAAADVEHDFKGRTDITVTGAVLEAEMKPTWGRLGLGGEFRLSDMMTVSGGAYYAAGGGGNKDLGGSLALNVSF